MTQGKCTTCRVRWTWRGARSRRQGVRCPCCGGELEQTTHLLLWRTRLATKEQIRGRPNYNHYCSGEKGCLRPVTANELQALRDLEPGKFGEIKTPQDWWVATLGRAGA